MSHKLSHEQASLEMQNAGLTTLEPYPGNKAKWLCRCNHCGSEVSPSLGSVRSNGGGCRICGTKRSAAKRRKSEIQAREVMIAVGAIPISDYQGSNHHWLSRCSICEREISPRLSNVLKGSAPCAFCAGKKVDPDDAIKLMNLNGLVPLVPYSGANKPWACECQNCGEKVTPMYSSIKSGQGGCKRCGYEVNSQKQLGNESDAIKFMTSKNLIPQVAYPGNGKPWLCRCLVCGHEVSPTLGSIKAGSGCAVCGKRQVVSQKAVEIMEASWLRPLVPFPGSHRHWLCECLRCGNQVSPKYTDIQSGDGGCKYCGGHYVEPEAAFKLMKSKGVTPQSEYVNSGTRWPCICDNCGRNVSPTYGFVQQGGSACAYCSRRKVDPIEAAELMTSVGVVPQVPYPGARNAWHCKCDKCGLDVYPFYSSVANNGANPCLFCAGKKVDGDSAFKIMLSAGLTPLEIYKRSDSPWRCTCNKCGRLVTPTYTSIRIGQGGCKYCANKGLDYTAPAFLYVMVNDSLGATKIGVGNHKTRVNRIAEHERNGWHLQKRLEFETGDIAFSVEQKILLWVRDELQLKPCLTPAQMPQGGYTETFDTESIELSEVWKQVEKVSSDLDT